MPRFCALLVVCSVISSGCQSPPTTVQEAIGPPASAPVPAQTAPPTLAADAQRLETLLERADAARAADHLIYPASGSAMSLYHEVLAEDPDNARAQRGLEQVTEHFLVAASLALGRGSYTKAGAMLSRARLVDPANPNIEPIAAQLRLLENATREKVTLDWRMVANRSPQLKPTLERMGALARQEGCRADIAVSSDAEGRWVYQQMSNSPGDRRIKAQIHIASPASVEVLCF